MSTFNFNFTFSQQDYTGECRPVPIDGVTELHVRPLDGDLFERFGNHVLGLRNDGSITVVLPEKEDVRDYIYAVAKGLAEGIGKQPDAI